MAYGLMWIEEYFLLPPDFSAQSLVAIHYVWSSWSCGVDDFCYYSRLSCVRQQIVQNDDGARVFADKWIIEKVAQSCKQTLFERCRRYNFDSFPHISLSIVAAAV